MAEPRGLIDTIRDMAATLVAMAHTRLDLLSTDLEEDREHWMSLAVTAVFAVFCLGIGVVLAVLLVVVFFWDTHRMLVLGLLAGVFLAAGLAAGRQVKHLASAKPRLFTSSLSELFKDRQQLMGRS